MPSISLVQWRHDRMPRLADIESQCGASLVLVPPQPNLVDENFRGYVLLSAHFQGFCRDLYTECAMIVVSKVRVSLQSLVQQQFTAHRKMDHGNPNLTNLNEDFKRFGFTLNLPADPANVPRVTHLGELNKWRNVAAHHGPLPVGVPPLSLPVLRSWRTSCDGLATSLDLIMYNQLKKVLRRAPWVP